MRKEILAIKTMLQISYLSFKFFTVKNETILGLLYPWGFLTEKRIIKIVFQLAWPRTASERLLGEMFEGSAAQFMAILEALSDSNRRTFHTGPWSSDSDMVDVAAELFFAGKEIIAGSF